MQAVDSGKMEIRNDSVYLFGKLTNGMDTKNGQWACAKVASIVLQKSGSIKNVVLGVNQIESSLRKWKRIDNEDQLEQKKCSPKYPNNLGPYFKTSTGISFNENELVNVDPKHCEPWKYANRLEDDMGDMQELIRSIKESGQLQPGLIQPRGPCAALDRSLRHPHFHLSLQLNELLEREWFHLPEN